MMRPAISVSGACGTKFVINLSSVGTNLSFVKISSLAFVISALAGSPYLVILASPKYCASTPNTSFVSGSTK